MDTVLQGINSLSCAMQGNTYLPIGDSGVCYNATQVYFHLLIALIVCLSFIILLGMLCSKIDSLTIKRLQARIAELENKS